MKRYASSKFRIVMLTILLAVGLFVTIAHAADAATGDATTQVVQRENLFTLIFSHWLDPVFWTIGVLSVIALTLIIRGFLANRADVLMPEASNVQMRELIEQRRFKDLLDFTETDPSFVSKAINASLKRANGGFVAMKEAMETSLGEQTAEQFRGIEYLNIIGNLGPLLGLLGTVMGMIQAFEAMHAAGGSAKPSELAFGISTALTHTFLGLCAGYPVPGGVRHSANDRGSPDGSRRDDRRGVAANAQARRAAPGPGRRAARDARDAAAGSNGAGRSATPASGPARRSVSIAAGVWLMTSFRKSLQPGFSAGSL